VTQKSAAVALIELGGTIAYLVVMQHLFASYVAHDPNTSWIMLGVRSWQSWLARHRQDYWARRLRVWTATPAAEREP
jgi:hypothetical protein